MIDKPCPINLDDLSQGKGIQKTVKKLSTSYSPSFDDLIIGEVVDTPPPNHLSTQRI